MDFLGLSVSAWGLILVSAGWIWQLVYTDKKGKKTNEIQQHFIAAYVLGVALLVVDGMAGGLNILAALNVLAGVLALLVLLKLKL
jgi:hypothetical protein